MLSNRRLPLVAVVALMAGCSATTPVGPTPTGTTSAAVVENPCDAARAQRARVPSLLKDGRLDRALRVIDAANLACPAEAPSTWAAEIATRAELGAWDDVRALAKTIESASDASADAKEAATKALDKAAAEDVKLADDDTTKAPMREKYKHAAELEGQGKLEDAYAEYLEAWDLWHPNGQALLQAGLVAERLSRTSEAQRLFDRGVAELEQMNGVKVAVDAPNEDGARGVAWSSTGRIAVTLERDVAILAQGTLREVTRLGGHADSTDAVAFSRDGKLVATGSKDRAVRLFRVADGELLAKLDGHRSAVNAVTFSADGGRLASASDDYTVRVWSVPDGREIHALKADGNVQGVVFSPDGKHLAAASDDTNVHVWSAEDGHQERVLKGHTRQVQSVAYSPDGAVIASGSWDDTIRLWDAADGRERTKIKAQGVNDIALSPDGKLIASASSGRRAYVYRVADGEELGQLVGHNEWVNAIAFSPDGKSLVTGSFDGSARVWSVADQTELRSFREHAATVYGIDVTTDGQTLASASKDTTVRLWHVGGMLPALRTLRGHKEEAAAVSFSKDGRVLASSSYDETVRRWRVDDASLIEVHGGKLGWVYGVALAPDASFMATGGNADGTLLWNLIDGSAPRKLDPHGNFMVAFSPTGDLVAACLSDEVGLFHVPDGREVRRLQGHHGTLFGLAFSPDGALVASASYDHDVRVTRVADGATAAVLAGHTDAVHAVSFSPAGDLLASGSFDRSVRIWSVADGKERMKLEGHLKELRAVRFSPHGEFLATGGEDGTIILWRTPTFDRMASLRSMDDADAGYAFTPDGFVEIVGSEPDKARENVLCRIGRVSFPFDVCRERFEIPGLLAKVVAGDTSYRAP